MQDTEIRSGECHQPKLLRLKDKAKIVEPIKYANGIGKAQINNISIASGEYTVTFIFDANDRLVQTNLISNERRVRVLLIQDLIRFISC